MGPARILTIEDDGAIRRLIVQILEAEGHEVAEAHDVLTAPVVCLGSRSVPTPYAPALERLVFPSADSVVESARRLAAWED